MAQHQIAVGVEGAAELVGLMFQIGFHLELQFHRHGHPAQFIDLVAAEALVELGDGAIAEHTDLAGQAHAGHGVGFAVVPAALPVGIGAHRLPLQGTDGNGEGGGLGSGGKDDQIVHPVRVDQRISQCRHAAHGRADDGMYAFDAHLLQGQFGGTGHILDAENGKIRPVGLAGTGIDAARSGGTETAAQGIDADDVKAVGVQRLARPDHVLPPAGSGAGRAGGGMRVRRHAGKDQDDIVLRRVQLAPAFIGDVHFRQHTATVHDIGFRQGNGGAWLFHGQVLRFPGCLLCGQGCPNTSLPMVRFQLTGSSVSPLTSWCRRRASQFVS